MESQPLLFTLIKYVLPEEIFDYFVIKKIEEQDNILHLYLDEKAYRPCEYDGYILSSKGFHPEATIKDFPIRNKGTLLHVRRRRWLVQETGQVVSREWDLITEGTRYTKGFATFLKGLIGYLPDTEPFP